MTAVPLRQADPQVVVAALADVLSRGRAVVLSGAGLSTDSGIPDYRGPTGVARGASPMTYQEFIGSREAQQRYWSRSFVGWPVMRRARPNSGHLAVTRLEELGIVDAVITQNVDRLHHRAGTRQVVELHGALERVLCLACRAISDRATLQRRLAEANPGLDSALCTDLYADLYADTDGDTAAVRPDGDVVLAEAMVRVFRPVPCASCGGGPLKPDVVFFGESVPKERVARCYDLVNQAESLLVLGSSLTVMSGYRFVRHAAKHGITVVIVNQGPTRGDGEADVRVDAPLGAVLPLLADLLQSPGVTHVT